MKIAYAGCARIPSRGADNVHVMKMCSAFANALAFASEGSTLTMVFTQAFPIEPDVDNVYEYYGVPENFDIIEIRPRLSDISLLKGFRSLFKMVRYVSKNDYDYIYSRDLSFCFYIAYIYHKDVYFEYHSSFVPNSKEDKRFRLLIKSKCFRKLIVITQALKRHYINQYGMDENQIYVVPDCADSPSESTVPAELVEASKGKFQIGYIGHLYKGRGIELLGDMAVFCPFAFFHIVGGNEKDIAYWKNKYESIKNIHFYGFVPPSQTASYGKSMDVLIAPYQNIVATESYSTPERSTVRWMSPMKLFEYMVLGKPIITSDLPVLQEVMTDGVNCILCAPDDVTLWCGAIYRLYDDKDFASLIADNAHRDSTKYTWNKRAKSIMSDVFDSKNNENKRYMTSFIEWIQTFFRFIKFFFISLSIHVSIIINKIYKRRAGNENIR